MKLFYKGDQSLLKDSEYKTSRSAGFDFVSQEEFELEPFQIERIPTGWFVDVKASSKSSIITELQIRLRSSVAKDTPIRMPNGVGTTDCDYPDEIFILVQNMSNNHHFIERGARIAQGVCTQVFHCDGVNVSDNIREGGFGSTNK